MNEAMSPPPAGPPGSTAVNPASPPPTATAGAPLVNNHRNEDPPVAPVQPSSEVKSEGDLEEELLLKWDDHHRSFFELAEDLCHQEQVK